MGGLGHVDHLILRKLILNKLLVIYYIFFNFIVNSFVLNYDFLIFSKYYIEMRFDRLRKRKKIVNIMNYKFCIIILKQLQDI